MSLSELKLTDDNISQKGVVAAPDRLTGSATENKMIFDRLIREIFQGLYNELLDRLEEFGVEHTVQFSDSEAPVKYLRTNADMDLESSSDGVHWNASGRGGHLIVDSNGVVMPQRTRMQFDNGTVEDDGLTTTVHCGRGEQGVPGKSAYEIAVENGYEGTEEEFDEAMGELPTHIGDNVRHITQEERQTWNAKQNALTIDQTPTAGSTNPVSSGGVYAAAVRFVTGSYTGNGSGSQTVSLGFAPRAVYVCRQDGSTHYNSNGFNFYCGGLALSGIPLKADGSTVLAVYGAGFRAYYNTSSTATLITANSSDIVYHYIAFA